jgi:hypothetical protein
MIAIVGTASDGEREGGLAMHVRRSISERIRSGLTIEERWKGADRGVIASWERGRDIGDETIQDAQDLAARARRGELVILPWKGGVERALKTKQKYGTMRYLAMWQGLRGESLDVDLDGDLERHCTATGMTVIFTNDPAKYAGQESEEEKDGGN